MGTVGVNRQRQTLNAKSHFVAEQIIQLSCPRTGLEASKYPQECLEKKRPTAALQQALKSFKHVFFSSTAQEQNVLASLCQIPTQLYMLYCWSPCATDSQIASNEMSMAAGVLGLTERWRQPLARTCWVWEMPKGKAGSGLPVQSRSWAVYRHHRWDSASHWWVCVSLRTVSW